MKRQVIQLPAQQNEGNFKVELLIGQTLEVDCNQHRLLGSQLESKTLEGWVMTTMSSTSNLASLHHDGVPGRQEEKKFITAYLVITVCCAITASCRLSFIRRKNVDVKYRVWKADETVGQAVVR